jgi:uncharacterized protein (UPF0333 family)
MDFLLLFLFFLVFLSIISAPVEEQVDTKEDSKVKIETELSNLKLENAYIKGQLAILMSKLTS